MANTTSSRRWLERGGVWAFGLGAVLALAGGGTHPSRALADEPDPGDVGLAARVAARVAAREAERRGPDDGVRLVVRRGEARLVREVARVDVTLDATNTRGNEVEWTRSFPVDPHAEVIRCSLERQGQAELVARTLTVEDGRRIYGEARRPPPTITPRGGKDPLRVERPHADLLQVTVFPVAPQETVRVRLAFVTPLAGRGRERVYTDPLWVTDDPLAERDPTLTPSAPAGHEAQAEASLSVLARGLTFTDAAAGVLPAGSTGGALAFAPPRPQEFGLRATLRFEAPDGLLPALSVPGGGLSARVALWRFDPAAFLAGRGLAHLGPRTPIHLAPLGGYTQRLVPGSFLAGDEPQPVAARVVAGAEAVTYVVEVVTPDGVQRFECAEPLARETAGEEVADAVSAWHRARMARHVLRWAGRDPQRLSAAIAYAVDVGVLLPQTAALAVPPAEQRRLPRASRRTYRNDGALLGSPNGEADFVAPPRGSLR